MAVIVGTNSYGDEAGLAAYAAARGVTITGDQTVLLIKAMDWLEIQPFTSEKYAWDQALQFPRLYTFYDVVAGVVPPEIIIAQYAAALLIDSGEDLNPVVGREKKSVGAGRNAITVEYMDNASSTSTYPQLTKIIARHLGGDNMVVRV